MELSQGQFKDLKESLAWQDICKELDLRIENLHQVMESEESTIETMYRCQGGIKAFREVRDNLLDFMINEASEERIESHE